MDTEYQNTSRNTYTGDATRRRIESYFINHWLEHSTAPTFREIARDLSISSTSVVSYHVHKLIREGRLVQATRGGIIIPKGMTITIQ